MENHKGIVRDCVARFLCAVIWIVMASVPGPVHAFPYYVKDNKLDTIEPLIPLTPDSSLTIKLPYSVGTPKGNISVSNSGAAVYSLGIDVPDGGSLTPQIGLSYNSQFAGYGLVGYGFTITGISAITRGGHDLFHDGILKGVTYTADDNFYLDGKRLILQSGTSAQDGAVYTVEGDPFAKVTVHGNYNNTTATAWFEVTTNSGITYQYGNSATSKIAYQNNNGCPRIASWYVNKAIDKHSNYITYEYAVSNLCIRPVSITYGQNEVQSRGIVNKINFSYQSLGDNARPFAIEDQQGMANVCLSSITTTSNNSVYRKYSFTYAYNSDQSTGRWARLAKVEEANDVGETFPPALFTWQGLPSPTVQPAQLEVATDDGRSMVEETSKLFLSADLNGDGIGDIIRVSPVKVTTAAGTGSASYDYFTYVYVSRSMVTVSGRVTYDAPLIYVLPAGISTDVIKSIFAGASVMDFDGDGYNDLVFPYQNTATDYWNQAVFYFIWGSDIAAGRTDCVKAFAVDLKSTDKAPLFASLDIDGNGKDEVVCIEQRQKDGCYPCTIVQFAGGTALNRTEVDMTLPDGITKDIEKVFVGDYNNDGLSDLILLYDGGYKIYFNNGGKTTDIKFVESNTKTGTDLGDYWRIQQGDFDGDGLLDFVYNKSGDSFLFTAHNNGDGTFTHTKAVDMGLADHSSSKDDCRFSLSVCDIDHDGRSDVMVCKAEYVHHGFPKFKNEYKDTQVKWYFSTGSGFKLAYNYTKDREADADENSIFMGDFDGDGNIELANYGSILTCADDSFTERINTYKAGSDLSQVGKITAVTDGFGNCTNILYAYATNQAVYKKNAAGSYPVNTYTLPLSLVEKVTEDNGAAGRQTTNYSYEDLMVHIAGRGMLGFKSVTAGNTTLGTTETDSIAKWDGDLWIPTETVTSNSVGSDTGTIVTGYTVSKADNNYFAYVSSKEVTDLDGNRTVTISNYDASKGVLLDETVENDGDNMYKKVIYSGYLNKSGVWLPTTLTMSQKHADDAEPYTSVTVYSYDDRGNVVSSTENSETDMALTTTAAYDVYGNVLSSATTGRGVKTITKHNEYDSSGRFVIKSYTEPASTVNTFTYDLWGNVLTECDATDPSNILTTEYTYDEWGRKTRELSADGIKTIYNTGWGSADNKKYYIKVSTAGKPTITTWYDKAGHEVLQETVGIMGMPVSKATTYNSNGQVAGSERNTGKLTIKQDFSYDKRGRIVKNTQSSGRSVAYSYGNRTVTMTTAGCTYTKTYDAWGNTVKSADPVSEVVYEYSSIGKPARIMANGATVTMTYDAAGNQLSLSDPDAGTSNYTYAADGTLLTQTDARGIKTINSYDCLGRLASCRIGQNTIDYTYGTSGNETLRLTKQAVNGNSIEYAHDKLGRITEEKRIVNGVGAYEFSYAYDSYGRLAKTTYPDNLEVTYQYDNCGFKTQTDVDGNTVYKLESADGLATTASFMGKLTSTRTLDKYGYERNRHIAIGSNVLDFIKNVYDVTTGNLVTRMRYRYPQETFSYDRLDRLVSARSSKDTMKVGYAPNGNILFKTGVGNFIYADDAHPHAVTEVENMDGKIPANEQITYFNDYRKIESIIDCDKRLKMDFSYGPDQERCFSNLYSFNGKQVRATVYAGDYEQIIENGMMREFYYLDGNTIIIKENGHDPLCCKAFTDNHGNILSVMDENGMKVFEATYDAWGKQTVLLNKIGLHRGYTGHEMLGEFDIINMNGRLYDPVLGRFFSPDNYVQMPDNSQSFNRYSYCLNNPLKYTDPSGELFGIDDALLAFTAFNVASSMMQAAYNGKNVWKAGALGLLSSAASYGIGCAFGNTGNIGHELLRAGAHGLTNGLISTLDGGSFTGTFISGVASSCLGSYAQSLDMSQSMMIASATAMGGIAAWIAGGDFLQGAMQGMNIGIYNHAMHDDNEEENFKEQQEGYPIYNMLPEIVITAKRINTESIITQIVYIGTLVNKYRSQGTYTMYQGKKQVFSCSAVSGASNCKSYTIPKGDWTVISITDRNEARFTSNGIGFTANLNPDPFYDERAGRNRQYIRIHPARSNGTNGCIGLRANTSQLIRARELIRNSLKKGLTVKLHVNIIEH